MKKLLWLFVFVLALSGCIYRSAAEIKELEAMLANGVGKMTLVDFIDMWGAPSSTRNNNVQTVAVWMDKNLNPRNELADTGYIVQYTPDHGTRLTLIFGKDDKLQSWSYKEW